VEVPVVLSEAYAYVLLGNISIDVYLVEKKRGVTLSLMSRSHVGPDSEGEPTELTNMYDNSRPSQPHSKPIPVGKG
jgi:hypothetical protein